MFNSHICRMLLIYTLLVAFICCMAVHCDSFVISVLKGELNLYNKWQSDDLFHVVINENHPLGNRF